MTHKKNNKKGGHKKTNTQVEQHKVEVAPTQKAEELQQQETQQEVAPVAPEVPAQEPAPTTYAEAAQEAEKHENVEQEKSKPQVVVAEPEEQPQPEEPSGTGVAVPENPAEDEDVQDQTEFVDFTQQQEEEEAPAEEAAEEQQPQPAAPAVQEQSSSSLQQPKSQKSESAVPYEAKKEEGKLFEGIPAIPRFFLLCIAVCVSLYIRTVFITLPKFFLKASFYIPNRIRLLLTPLLLQFINETVLPLAKDLYAKAKVIAKEKFAAGLEWAKPKLAVAFNKAAALYQKYHLQDKLKFLLKKLVSWTRAAVEVYKTVRSTYIVPATELLMKVAKFGITKVSEVYTVLLARTTFLRAQVATVIQFAQEVIIPVIGAVKKYVDTVIESLSKFIAEGYQTATKVIANVKFLQLPFLASSAPEPVSQQ